MDIFGFHLGKKQFIIIGAVVFLIGALVAMNMIKDAKAKQEAIDAANAAAIAAAENANTTTTTTTTEEELTFDEEYQLKLVEKYGDAPDGFEWDAVGNLVALGSDAMTADEVVYTYLRSLSILDFSTAQMYAATSNVTETYSAYYADYTQSYTDYYSNFLRKQYKVCLTSLEINEVQDVAIFADGTEIITISISSLDLTDKDFWLEDKDAMFEMMRVYDETESDSVKLQTFVYDYIYASYVDGSIAKTDTLIEIVVAKDNGGAWLVSNDAELDAVLSYANGVDVAEYILDEYDEWYRDVTLQEKIDSYTN